MPERSPGSSAKAEAKRERLLAAAAGLFSTRGFAKTRISHIVAAAKTGISTFYRHFPTKEALLEAALAIRFRQVREELTRVREDVEHRSLAEQVGVVRRTYEIAFDALVGRPGLTRILFATGYGSSAAVRELVQGQLAGFAADVAAVLERLEAAERVRITDKLPLAQASVGAVLHLAHTHLCEGAPTREEAIRTLTGMLLGSVVVSDPGWAMARMFELQGVMPRPETT